MSVVKRLMLWAAGTACLVLVTPNFGLDLKYYKYLSGSVQLKVCRDAMRANPDVGRQLQTIAERCVKKIQAELAPLAARNPCLMGISQAQIELGEGANETERVMCGLMFRKDTHMVEVPSGGFQEPNKDECILFVWVRNILGNGPPTRHYDVEKGFLVHEIEMCVSYFLMLSNDKKDLDTTVRAILDQRIKEMCDEMKKLQTAEDKAADKE